MAYAFNRGAPLRRSDQSPCWWEGRAEDWSGAQWCGCQKGTRTPAHRYLLWCRKLAGPLMMRSQPAPAPVTCDVWQSAAMLCWGAMASRAFLIRRHVSAACRHGRVGNDSHRTMRHRQEKMRRSPNGRLPKRH
jgi:hypothetical protein